MVTDSWAKKESRVVVNDSRGGRYYRDKAIIMLYTLYNYTQKQIGDAVNLTKQRIGQILTEKGIKKRNMVEVRSISKQELGCRISRGHGVGCTKHHAMLIGYFVENKNLTEIGRDLDVCRNTVSYNLKKRGIYSN